MSAPIRASQNGDIDCFTDNADPLALSCADHNVSVSGFDFVAARFCASSRSLSVVPVSSRLQSGSGKSSLGSGLSSPGSTAVTSAAGLSCAHGSFAEGSWTDGACAQAAPALAPVNTSSKLQT